jgi:ankyrin repeat protein
VSVLRTEFIKAATWHGSLDRAREILAAHPGLATADIHTAAILGDDAAVRGFLDADPANATATSAEPYGANALTHLGLSKYLRLDPSRSDGLMRAATALLDAGADPNGGFWTKGAHPEFETPLYGAAGVAHHAALTRLLVDRGADVNDVEVCYHTPESYDNRALHVLVETGRIEPANLSMMLVRKHDWHDIEGAKYLLEHGADPNEWGPRNWSPLHHAISRDNRSAMIELLLDHGVDATRRKDGVSPAEFAARRGRGDVLALFEQRGVPAELHGLDRLLAAAARHDATMVRSIAEGEPELVGELIADGGTHLARFAGTWNTVGVALLLDLGVDVNAEHDGEPYFGTPLHSTALHVAAWRGVALTVKLLLDRGATVNAKDGNGDTPLVLAVRATVDSYWMNRRTPEAVRALLDARATIAGVQYPTGYDEVDELLAPFQRETSRPSS